MAKRTLEGTKRKKIRNSGFRQRMKSVSGRRIIKARRSKGRKSLTVS